MICLTQSLDDLVRFSIPKVIVKIMLLFVKRCKLVSDCTILLVNPPEASYCLLYSPAASI